jgi:hypothetical protein
MVESGSTEFQSSAKVGLLALAPGEEQIDIVAIGSCRLGQRLVQLGRIGSLQLVKVESRLA